LRVKLGNCAQSTNFLPQSTF